MSAIVTLAVLGLLVGGVAFTVVAAVGLVRLPDLYSRTHAASKSETLGAALALAAVAVAVGPSPALAKVGLLVAFVFVTGPTAAHAIARAAYEEGHHPWVRPGSDPTTDDASPATGAATDGGRAVAEIRHVVAREARSGVDDETGSGGDPTPAGATTDAEGSR